MLQCVECGTTSERGEGWKAVLAQDPDEDPVPFVAVYCPECAELVTDSAR